MENSTLRGGVRTGSFSTLLSFYVAVQCVMLIVDVGVADEYSDDSDDVCLHTIVTAPVAGPPATPPLLLLGPGTPTIFVNTECIEL